MKRVTDKYAGDEKKRFVADLNKNGTKRKGINEMKAFNGNLKPYFQYPLPTIIGIRGQLFRKLKRKYFHFNPLTVERYYTL